MNLATTESGCVVQQPLMQHLNGCGPEKDFPDSSKRSSNVAKALWRGLYDRM